MRLDKINVYPYKGRENPAVDYILKKFLPTLKYKVEDILREKGTHINDEFYISDLPKNDNILSMVELEKQKKRLLDRLDEMSEILEPGQKPIVLIADGCFTNQLLIKQLKEILEDKFDDYVTLVDIDYEKDIENPEIEANLYDNSIVILGGSYSDTYTIPNNMYSGPLFDFIQKTSKDTIGLDSNNKILGVCFGQQYINNIMGIDRIFTERIMTTMKGPAQFGYMPAELSQKIDKIPYVYQGLMNSLTNYGQNKEISTVLTRTGHVDFNLLNSYTVNSSSTITLMKDKLTGGPLVWGTINGNIIGSQPHFEVNPLTDREILMKEFKNLVPFLTEGYSWKVKHILRNLGDRHPIQNNLGEIFYTSALLSFAEGIVSKYNFKKNNQKDKRYNPSIDVTRLDFDNLVKEGIKDYNFHGKDIAKEKYIEELDKQGKLKMLTTLDWKVNRGAQQIGETLGLKDLTQFIKLHKKFIEKVRGKDDTTPYVFRDFGAGNGTLVKEIDNLENIYGYGVGDFAYFDVFEGLQKVEQFKKYPPNIIKIFLQEFFENMEETSSDLTYPERVKIAIKGVDFSTKIISGSSMFAEDTSMFNDKHEKIGIMDRKFIKTQPEKLEGLKKYVEKHFYNIVEGYFEKLLISDFNSLFIKNEEIKHIDFQTAIRSTSHIDGPHLEKSLYDYVMFNSKPGSIYFDNGVVRSYSSVPRIKEYVDLEEKMNGDIKVYFTYDTKTNYIDSAVILRKPFMPAVLIEKNLSDGTILLEAKDLLENSFFRVERFYRELIILTFKDYKVFYHKNKDIMNFLKFLSRNIMNMGDSDIKKMILIGINGLVYDVNKDFNENYSKMSLKDLNFYILRVDPTIKEILIGNLVIQSWFNTDFDRKN